MPGTPKSCVKRSCSLKGLEVTTDNDECLSCGERLQPALASMLNEIFEPLTPFGRP